MAEGSGSILTLAIRRVIRAPPETVEQRACRGAPPGRQVVVDDKLRSSVCDMAEPAEQYWLERATCVGLTASLHGLEQGAEDPGVGLGASDQR